MTVTLREALAAGPLKNLILGLDALVTRGGGEYFADGRLTVADLKVFVQVRALIKGALDHIPPTFVTELAPNLAKHCERLTADARIVAYYAARKK